MSIVVKNNGGARCDLQEVGGRRSALKRDHSIEMGKRHIKGLFFLIEQKRGRTRDKKESSNVERLN